MLKAFKLRAQMRHTLLQSGVAGQINAHGAQTNLESLNRLLTQDPYVTFGIQTVEKSMQERSFTLAELTKIMAAALGISVERFHLPGPGYIDPELTARRLEQMVTMIETAIDQQEGIVLATAHPGSLLHYYLALAKFITDRGGSLAGTATPVLVAEYRWIDSVAGVHVLTDEGGLLHTHDSAGFDKFLSQLPQPPALVIADHGYAGAAINRRLKTIAIHDVDDPGIPLAAHLECDVLPIPMNDNQLNQPTATVIDAVLAPRGTP